MESISASPLINSWPLFERNQRFDLGCHFNWDEGTAIDFSVSKDRLAEQGLAEQGLGVWDCDLSDNSLSWSAGVYDLFGLPRGSSVDRPTTVALYREPSRAAMERLRAYALKHRRGFTLDVEIAPANGGLRWIRLVAAPLCVNRMPVRLRGFKRDVTHEYV